LTGGTKFEAPTHLGAWTPETGTGAGAGAGTGTGGKTNIRLER